MEAKSLKERELEVDAMVSAARAQVTEHARLARTPVKVRRRATEQHKKDETPATE